MKIYILIFLVTCSNLKLLLAEGFRCYELLNGDALFSLQSLSSITDYNYTTENYRFYFNFCTFASKLCKNQSAYAVAFPLDSEKNEIKDQCFRLTSDSYIKNFAFSSIDNRDASKGVVLSYSDGDLNSENVNYDSQFKINCEKGITGFVVSSANMTGTHLVFIGDSEAGCPVLQISAIYNFILKSQYILASIMLIIGVIECFFGLYLLGPSLFGIGFLTGFGVLFLFLAEFIIKPDTGTAWLWFAFILCLSAGGGLGYLATSLPKVGFFGLGIWLGIVVAFILNNLFLYLAETNALLYLMMVLFAAIGAVLSTWKWKIICVLSTSILGGYVTVRGLSIFIGYYPDELTIAKKIQYKELDGVGWPFYVYFVFIVVLSVSGMIFQFKNMKKGGKFNGEFGMAKDDEYENEVYELSLLNNKRKK